MGFVFTTVLLYAPTLEGPKKQKTITELTSDALNQFDLDLCRLVKNSKFCQGDGHKQSL